MKAVINIVALLSALAGTSSNAYAYKLRGEAVALTGTAEDILLPQSLSDVTADADAADEGQRRDKCLHDRQYWRDHKPWCISHGYHYSGGGSAENKSCRKHNCEEDREYYKNNKSCCDNNHWPYDSHGPRFQKHKCEDNWDFWKEHKHWCRDHGYCYGCDDAELIADIFTGVYDEDFKDENYPGENFQGEDIKDDSEEAQDE